MNPNSNPVVNTATRWVAQLTAAVVLAGGLAGVAAPARAEVAPDVGAPWTVAIKVGATDGCSIGALSERYALELVDTLLESRRLYLIQSPDPLMQTIRKADDLAKKLSGDGCVVYAERNQLVILDDSRFHAWPTGQPKPATEGEWREQPGSTALDLATAQTLSRGAGVKVAVLDTGVDGSHPDLAGHVLPGWDYIDDDADAAEVEGEVFGHGTFVAGVVHLVSPDAQIIPMRVLSGDGLGNGYEIAEAIRDAVAMGARVVNLSFGTVDKIESKVLTETIKWARSKGTLTTAAAGNDGDELRHWPAAQREVVSVASLDTSNDVLASYSTRGDWVDVAALGTDLVSLMPGAGFDSWSGTSMATPVVSAQLAMIIAAAPRLDASHVEEKVRSTAKKLSGQRLHYGRVSITASVQKALR